MRIRKILSAVLCLCLMPALCSCGEDTEIREGDSYIYCLNEERTGLVKVPYEISREDPVPAAEAMLEEMKKPAQDIEYTSVFPQKVEVDSCELAGNILYLDFNEEYLKIDPLEEKLVRAAIVQSLLQIDGIFGVQFQVEGQALQDSSGRIIGLMNEDDFVQSTGSSPSSYQTASLTLYFANEEGDKLTAQTIDVKYNSNIPKEKLIVEKLMQGPKESGAYPTINPETNLLGVTIKDGICYVNFDGEFLNSAYDVLPEVTIYSIVNSLVEGTSAGKVQITVNGESNVVYMDQVDLSQPLEADIDWAA